MPRFSVIVPVHRVQGYLRACLESVLTQSLRDVELIVVDDASPDGSGAIAAEFAARDSRVRVLTHDLPLGTGAARNAGADRARGDYLLFLDGDDLLLPGALRAIADRLAAAGDPGPDVLLFGHDRVDWRDDTAARPGGDDLGPGADPLAVTVAAWNRVLRRAFFTGHDLHFTSGPYEDVLPVQRATLLAGDRVATLDRACVRWRERRSGAAAARPGRHHFAVIEAYRRLLDQEPAARDRLVPPMLDHLRQVLTDRVPEADRAAFLKEARTLGPLTYTRPARVAPLAGRAKRRLRTAVMRAAYRTDLRTSGLDANLAVYGAYWNRGVACNPAAVYAKAAELAPHIRGVWVVSSRHRDRVPEGVPYVIEGSRAYWRTMARATYLVNNSSFPGGFTKRPGQTYLQTHHGTPLKTMGVEQRRYPATTHGFHLAKVMRHVDQWDFSLSSNPHSTETWDRVYPSAAYRHLELGYPRNDVFLTATPADTARVRARLGIPEGRTVLLYAPTHRDYQKGFTPRLDLHRFARDLGDEHVLLLRAHYFYTGRPHEVPPNVVDVSDHPSAEELCLAADALVTDYSSLMFDYACLDRPIITYAPDWPAYRAARGTYFDLLSGRPGDTPGAVATTEDDLLSVLRENPDTSALRAAFRERFCPWDDGHAAERVVRRFFLGEPVSPPGR
ncbi:CDP-glycerol glycerophosphotransferase family protein [Streptomyces sp. NPDC060194]|uniref:bifunctional glycosyltransferase/CDP-glycerol:glycerophosphate glycerophosphotransferase n=1 Tax=Streptomyces sp. NPDC060194 TaxID=3347069 RepID=UPI003646A1C2